MAGFFQQQLIGSGQRTGQRGTGGNGNSQSTPYLKDYKHASKIFLTNAYGNVPKFKYLFHVYFDINETKISDNLRIFPETANHGLLVKTIDLPKYQIPLTEMNQYNRKRLIQTKINYEPVRATFHDDNSNQIRNLWFAYYSYYYNDPNQPNRQGQALNDPKTSAGALNYRNIYDNDISSNQRNWGYLGESFKSTMSIMDDRKHAFFKSIKIYGFNQHNFVMYELINPMIENFSHDSYNYSDTTGTMECSMSFRYESVKYYDGKINGENPGAAVERFAETGMYDKDLSPIARAGSNRLALGQGSLVDPGQEGTFEDLSDDSGIGANDVPSRMANADKNSQAILQEAQDDLLEGAYGAGGDDDLGRSAFDFPGLGSTDGPYSQYGNASNDFGVEDFDTGEGPDFGQEITDFNVEDFENITDFGVEDFDTGDVPDFGTEITDFGVVDFDLPEDLGEPTQTSVPVDFDI